MGKIERLYKIERMLRTRKFVPIRDFLAELEVSTATFKRDIEHLRERLNAPIPWDRAMRGYRLHDPDPAAPRHELPGLWFSSAETHALLTFHHLLDRLQPGLLTPHIQPLQERIRKLLEKDDHTFEEVARRIRVLPLAARALEPAHFQTIAHALFARKRLRIVHYHRQRDAESEREVSPQRLAHYRDNWYLDAWDHGKKALRIFSMDTIRRAAITGGKARTIPEKRLDAELGSGYGIFAGRKTQTAVLRFTPERARWVANEQWHPKQKSRFEKDYYILEIPYSDDRELLMDILKYGPDVEVLAPENLRNKVRERLLHAMCLYG